MMDRFCTWLKSRRGQKPVTASDFSTDPDMFVNTVSRFPRAEETDAIDFSADDLTRISPLFARLPSNPADADEFARLPALPGAEFETALAVLGAILTRQETCQS
jgi:hypothetical protein